MSRELPPTAGLPLRFGDLLPRGAGLAAPMAAWLGVDEVQIECSGTASLVLLLQAMKRLLPQRREVVVPAWTCPLVAIAIQHAGLSVRLCDLAFEHYDMSADALRAVCNEHTLAIVPTHLAGRVADVQTSISIAAKFGAFVIEDAAQALGAQVDGVSVGLRGDAGFFSLAVGKGLTLFEGGVLTIRNPGLRAAVAQVREQLIPTSIAWECRRSIELLGYAALYRPSLLSFAYGRPLRKALAAGDPVAAVGDDFGLDIALHRVGSWRQGVGVRALSRLPKFLRDTRAQALRRIERLRQLEGIKVLADPPAAQGVWPVLLLILPSEKIRDAALQRLWTSGLGVSRLFIYVLSDYGYLKGIVGAGDFPQARDMAARTLTISNSLWLDDLVFERICIELERVLTRI
jgi:dTDP-4-amino-4,6-dideoxygalactose transaminase